MKADQLVELARQARQYAYAPYSSFKVGAALLADSGEVYTGCNIENASYSLTCCAERTAIFKAVSNGVNAFRSMAIIGNTKEPISPCGACRQVMAEFFSNDVKIYLANEAGAIKISSIGELLPIHFDLND